MRRRVWAVVLGACALAWVWSLTCAPVAAMVVLPVDFDTMVAESRTIVHGRVVDVRVQARNGRGSLESLVTVEVLSLLKGAPSGTVAFRVPNGQIGRVRRVTIGAPEFAAGDEVVVFLPGGGPALPVPYGLSQGVYRVERDSLGRALVHPRRAAATSPVRGDPAVRPVGLEVFAARVRTAAEREP